MTDWFKVAPLSDEDLLGAVQASLRDLVLPELERLGAEDFLVSQVRSTMSIVGFVRRGLQERAAGRERLLEQAEAIAANSPQGRADPEARRLLLELLSLEIRTRSAKT